MENIDKIHVVACPHCGILVEILELNCRIFRCGIYKQTYLQINPHMSKDECEALVLNDSIYGCGKPFRIPDGEVIAVVCDYI
jgi:hypothetical protein